MELLVAADSLLYKTPDGKYWCETIYGYNFWLRYLTAFDDVAIVSRTKTVNIDEVKGFQRVDGPHVRVLELPYLRGMKKYIINYYSFSKAAKMAAENAECALFRLPSVSAEMVLKYYKRKGKPYGIEVVADPFDAYNSNMIARNMYTKKLKQAALQANGVSYVTKFYLQKKYPSYSRINGETEENFESYFSTIDLPDTYFTKPRSFDNEKNFFTIIHTANSINNDIKGHETLIKVLKMLREKQFNVKTIFIGDGSQRSYYEQMTRDLGIEEYVTFTGIISSPQEVRNLLLQGDIFVFPSKAEGLPRALIEAMAVALPCLSTNINGIPELLSEEFLFDPLDIDGFTNKLIQLMNQTALLEKMSRENVIKAKEYSSNKLQSRRNEFYSKLKNLTL